jgi:plasmid maintenance system killer protein
MFVFVISQKYVFAFREKSLRKVTKITKVFAKTFGKVFKTKIVAKNDAGSEKAMKYPNSKRQTKFGS